MGLSRGRRGRLGLGAVEIPERMEGRKHVCLHGDADAHGFESMARDRGGPATGDRPPQRRPRIAVVHADYSGADRAWATVGVMETIRAARSGNTPGRFRLSERRTF